MYSLNENALEKSAQSPKPLKSLGLGRKPLNLELEDEIFCYIVSRLFLDMLIFEPCLFQGVTVLGSAYFRAMLIFEPVLIIENIQYV